MKSLGERWNRWWFEPSTADNLGLARILLFGTMAVFYISTPYLFPGWGYHETFNEWGGVSAVFWKPIWLFRVLHLPQFSVGEITALDAIWKIALVFSAIGLFTRFSNAVAFVISIYLFGIQNNFGRTHHLEILLLWAFLIMTFSRCGDSWSIDRLLKTARTGSGPGSEPPRLSGEYTWPIRLIWVVMAMIYFAAGCSKLRHSGIAWVTSNAMSYFLMRPPYHVADAEPILNWGLWMSRHSWASHGMAAMGIGLELSYPIALFSRRLRYLIMASGMMMQTGIALFMGPNFYQMILCQLLWLPLDRIFYWFIGKFSGEKIYTIVFDGSCGLCKRTIAVVKSLDLLGHVEYLDAVNNWPEILKRYSNLDRARCMEDMHAISSTGKVRAGFEAYRGLAWVVPLGWVLLPVFYFPGASIIGPAIYRMVADSRQSGSCALPPAVSSITQTSETTNKV
jgi:predicted DCC family thiol-disulfide oxidoreductase YuxK